MNKIVTFPIPFSIEEINENITINTNKSSNSSEEEIIIKGIKFLIPSNIRNSCLSSCSQPTSFLS